MADLNEQKNGVWRRERGRANTEKEHGNREFFNTDIHA